ncbi:MAG: hypothetical protein ACYC60_22835, partial [Thermoanaerobaculia bacterium]
RAKLFAWKDSRDVFRSRAAHCFAPTQVIQFLGRRAERDEGSPDADFDPQQRSEILRRLDAASG